MIAPRKCACGQRPSPFFELSQVYGDISGHGSVRLSITKGVSAHVLESIPIREHLYDGPMALLPR